MSVDHNTVNKGHFENKTDPKSISAPGTEAWISLTDLSSSKSEPARFSSTFTEAISKQVCGLAGPSQAKATEWGKCGGLTCHKEVNSKQKSYSRCISNNVKAGPSKWKPKRWTILPSAVVFHFSRFSCVSPRDPSAAQEIGWEYNTAIGEVSSVSLLPHIPEMAESKPKYNQSTLYGEPDRHLILMTK